MAHKVSTTVTVASSPYGQTYGDIGSFSHIFDQVSNPLDKGLDGADALLLWGGEDIHPSFYKNRMHYLSGSGREPSRRDMEEWNLMHDAVKRGIPIIGVCRGAQFICAFAGGSLYQHVNGHNRHHSIVTHDKQEFVVTSSHHQMMNPRSIKHKLLAWTPHNLSTTYEEETVTSNKEAEHSKESEIVYFPEIKAIGIQPHPEWMDKDCAFNEWLNQQIIDHLFV